MTSGITVVLRFLWYLLSRLLIGAAAVGLVVLSFFMAMDYMNVQTLVKDGLSVRAEVVLKDADPTALSKVFSKSFLEQDTLLNSDTYKPYDVSYYNYNVDVGFALVFPWNSTVTVEVTEKVTSIKADLYATTNPNISETPPAWNNAVYRVKLVRNEDNWRIVSMEQVKLLPTPSPTASPTPAGSTSASPATSGEASPVPHE